MSRYWSASIRFDIDTAHERYLTVRYRYGFDVDKSIVETSMFMGFIGFVGFIGFIGFIGFMGF